MGTGIVSIALSLDGQETLSRVLLALDAAVWVILAILLPARALRDRARFRRDLRTPAAFTAVAAFRLAGDMLDAHLRRRIRYPNAVVVELTQ